MATQEQQVKLRELEKKIHLYKTRITDAQQKSRPDIERIWVSELKIVERKRQVLKEEISNNTRSTIEPSPATDIPNAERQLRQIDNQIAYIKKKITIHQERGEMTAAAKQTALLENLERQRKTLLPTPPPPLPSHISSTPKTIKRLNAEIAHANKMISEYKKFNSPKANEWIGKKFQLEAQRDRLLAEQPTPIPPPLPITRPPPATIVDTAIDINKQIRIIDLELTHADKMIREYQKFHSPKVNQWIQRKNELLARRARITGHATPSMTNPANDLDIQRRLQVILLELAHADKMIREYQKYNSPKVQEWIDKRNDLLAERAFLQGNEVPSTTPNTQPQPIDREAIKARIVEYNRQAQNADKLMRIELQRGNHQQAIAYKEQRDFFNLEVKKLTASLNSTHTITPVTPSQPDNVPTLPVIGNPSAQERNIANRYLHDRHYSHEHVYRDLINLLTQQTQYRYLAHAKDTLFDITQANQLPPRGTTINMAFVRDCFKIRTSDIQLEGYTINDTIFNTPFPTDFDKSIDRINTVVGEAPPLKHFSLLAHRDAIQLIPVDTNIARHNSQYAGAKLSNITIRNLNINSEGPLQGLFASDGCFENIHLENIHIQTASQHQIAILGMLSGTLSLSSTRVQPIHVNLLPLRLGGGRNIYINSFSEDSLYQYGQVNSGNSNAIINDNRLQMNKRGKYYQDFSMEDFFASLRRADPNTHILDQIEFAAETAGRLFKEI
ncbi:MAG: Unknown protein [uncultured Thiotrichaceae bacterium]|uniref:Uncharacterized protein n=1 Tax=uncultured Thiotrichaceae bacterium TaxID=298394 RepID=A0A6S6S720_9GAMM|nr:MAG: Unknown protein [uncultured Thiotrichaceae bacterium]